MADLWPWVDDRTRFSGVTKDVDQACSREFCACEILRSQSVSGLDLRFYGLAISLANPNTEGFDESHETVFQDWRLTIL